MKTILWATLTANGNYAQSSPEHPPTQEALNDFASQVEKIGNFIVGRRTFEGFRANGGGDNAFANTDIVVVSKQGVDIPGVVCAASPEKALEYLKEKGHKTALLSGGEQLHNALLAQNLVDELILNIAPEFEGQGLKLSLQNRQHKALQLLSVKEMGGGLVQLHYAIHR